MLLTLSGWTSARIAEALGVREDAVRLWRSDFARGDVAALQATVAPGPAAVKSETALRVVTPLLEAPVADRHNWTIARLRAEIEAREGVRISRSHDLKAHHLAHQTFADADALDTAIHAAVTDLNRERMAAPLAKPRISA